MRSVSISLGEHYHVFNRENNKQLIFLEKKDLIRFLFLIIFLQSPIVFQNFSRQVAYFSKNSVFKISKKEIKEISKGRYVKLVNFSLMPNHFHLTLCEFKEGGISQYMQRVLVAYTKYFNTKYKKSGHLFQGPYKAVHIESDEQLLHLSAYIHRNPIKISEWKNKLEKYPWSSYQDYALKNRWGELLSHEIISERFENKKEYDDFVKTSGTKEIEEVLDEQILIDSQILKSK